VGAHSVRPRLHVIDLFALVTPFAFAWYATIAPLWEWDFWAIWGLEARVFLEAGGIDWRFLTSPWNTFAHPDYPLLLPLAYDFVRRAIVFDDVVAWRHGAILLGLAACTKNEGLAMLASTAIAIVVSDVRRWRRVVRLWPAAAIALPWLVLRALHDLPTDVVGGSIASRLVARLPEAGKIFAMLNADLHEPWFWTALLLGIVA